MNFLISSCIEYVVVVKVAALDRYFVFSPAERANCNKCFLFFSSDGKLLKTWSFSGSKSLRLSALLVGGKGDVAWQHAQLFRQPINNKDEFPLDITVSLRDP